MSNPYLPTAQPSPQPVPDVVVGVTGASGALYAVGVVRGLVAAGWRAHLVVSPYGRRLLFDEMGLRGTDAATLLGPTLAGQAELLVEHRYHDVGSKLASGSFLTRGMVVVPCSANSLGQFASGLGDNLISRAAAVTLKERRRLVLAYREMPMSRIDLENALRLDAAGAVFCPANPGFYLRPQSVQDLVDMVVGKCLDLIGCPHGLHVRWAEEEASPHAAPDPVADV